MKQHRVVARYALMFFAAVLLLQGCGGKRSPQDAEGQERHDSARLLVLSEESAARADTLDLGRVHEGETLLKELSMRNMTGEPIVITGIDSGCGCLLFEYSKQPIHPGSDSTVKLRFYSAGLYGEVVRTAKIKSSASDALYTLVITAVVH